MVRLSTDLLSCTPDECLAEGRSQSTSTGNEFGVAYIQ